MTGFGRGTAAGPGFEVSVEVNSVNRRNLETLFSMPKDWQVLERSMAKLLRGSLSRGRVHTSVSVDTGGGEPGLTWDDAEVEATVKRFEQLAHRVGNTAKTDPDVLLRIILALQANTALPDSEQAEPVVIAALKAALSRLCEMRSTEGAALAADLSVRLELLQSLLDGIREAAAGRVEQYRELLHGRLKQAGLEIDPDDERVLKEIAIFADRCDVTEELTRLESHLGQFVGTMSADVSQGIGRKLEFILQEINREFNTIGSKSNSLDVSKSVIEAKNEIERIREQIQNIE